MIGQSLPIEQIVARTKRRMETVVHEIIQDLAQEVILRTPVREGFLRGSWFVTLNSQTGTFVGSEDKEGSQTMGRVSLEVNELRIGDTLFMLNQANYAVYVEFGTSRQDPAAMVRSTIRDAPQIAEATARRIGTS